MFENCVVVFSHFKSDHLHFKGAEEVLGVSVLVTGHAVVGGDGLEGRSVGDPQEVVEDGGSQPATFPALTSETSQLPSHLYDRQVVFSLEAVKKDPGGGSQGEQGLNYPLQFEFLVTPSRPFLFLLVEN